MPVCVPAGVSTELSTVRGTAPCFSSLYYWHYIWSNWAGSDPAELCAGFYRVSGKGRRSRAGAEILLVDWGNVNTPKRCMKHHDKITPGSPWQFLLWTLEFSISFTSCCTVYKSLLVIGLSKQHILARGKSIYCKTFSVSYTSNKAALTMRKRDRSNTRSGPEVKFLSPLPF